MTAILGFTDLLVAESPTAFSIEAAQTVKRNGEFLLGLINDILDLSKVEAGRMTMECVACSPVQIVQDVVSLMRVRAAAKGLELSVVYPGLLPTEIVSDPLRLRQILLNLVGNAIKFTEQGSVRVSVRIRGAAAESCSSAGDSRLQIDVIDTGIGMSPEETAQLFRPFSQADATVTRRFGGTGLGLTISKHLALLLGGDVWVSRTDATGSTFTLEVATGPLDGVRWSRPVVSADVRKLGAVLAAIARSEPEPERITAKILLAEDGLDNQRLLVRLLSHIGATVTAVENGTLAVSAALAAQAEGQPFDLILMDMQMPVLDGYRATAELRATGCTTPIIALTAHAMATDRQKCLAAGCSEYITKPVSYRELFAKIREQLAASNRIVESASEASSGPSSIASAKSYLDQLP
jgi:CheY-like chemotaxis protein